MSLEVSAPPGHNTVIIKPLRMGHLFVLNSFINSVFPLEQHIHLGSGLGVAANSAAQTLGATCL